MAEKFLDSRPLRLTPLSPVHVGCGLDYEPTGYVIEGNMLYSFDPARSLSLDEAKRQELLGIVDSGGSEAITRLQRFFYGLREQVMAAHILRLAVGDGVQDFYATRVGNTQSGGDRNKLFIERTQHVAGTEQAILPGSSVKGAIRTALLSRSHGGKPLQSPQMAERSGDWKKLPPLPETLGQCLPQDFSRDPMRLIHVADAMPMGGEQARTVLFAQNFKRDGKAGRGPYQILECLEAPAMSPLTGSVAFLDPGSVGSSREQLPSVTWKWQDMVTACNDYYLPKLRQELQELGDLLDQDWLQAMRQVLAVLERADGKAFLLRVGRHSGAEAVTLDGARHIKIMQGKGQNAAWKCRATTVWLAAERNKQDRQLRPFGWVLVEAPAPGDVSRLEPLAGWSGWAAQRLGRYRQRLAQSDERLAALRQRQEEAARKVAEVAAKRQAEAEEKARREAELAQLSPVQRRIEVFRGSLDASGPKQKIGGALWNEAQALHKECAGWTPQEKQELREVCEGVLLARLEGVSVKKLQEKMSGLYVP
ncbi:MAG: type III-A CRISPR-associated RAMP protein Csm5 [Magnetococcus sp. WYHC-3]